MTYSRELTGSGWVLGNLDQSTWATRGTGSFVGQQRFITDVGAGGGAYFVWDGTNWRPLNGRVSLYNRGGSNANPIGSLTWAGAAVFMAIPGGAVRIPAGIIVPQQTKVVINALWATGVANSGGMVCRTTIGTSNSWSDTQLTGSFLGVNNEYWHQIELTFPSTTTAAMQANATQISGNPSGGNPLSEYNTNINTAADMFINFGTENGSTNGNVLRLQRASVELFL